MNGVRWDSYICTQLHLACVAMDREALLLLRVLHGSAAAATHPGRPNGSG